MSPWMLFFLSVLETQSEHAIALMLDEPVNLFLSEMQQQIWDYIQTQDTVSRRGIIKATGLNPRTVDHTLRKLSDMNKLERIGQGRATRFKPLRLYPQRHSRFHHGFASNRS